MSETKKIGEVFFDGRILNLDTTSVDELMIYLNQIEKKEAEYMEQLDCIIGK